MKVREGQEGKGVITVAGGGSKGTLAIITRVPRSTSLLSPLGKFRVDVMEEEMQDKTREDRAEGLERSLLPAGSGQ